jgi:hypothetical protein
MPIVSEAWEAGVGGLFGPRNSIPAWEIESDPIKKKENLQTVHLSYCLPQPSAQGPVSVREDPEEFDLDDKEQ